jgi:hypothetical protein
MDKWRFPMNSETSRAVVGCAFFVLVMIVCTTFALHPHADWQRVLGHSGVLVLGSSIQAIVLFWPGGSAQERRLRFAWVFLCWLGALGAAAFVLDFLDDLVEQGVMLPLWLYDPAQSARTIFWTGFGVSLCTLLGIATIWMYVQLYRMTRR